MTPFEQERKEIRERIWAFLNLRGDERVLDVGVGHSAYSLKKLIELGVSITSIDINYAVLNKYKTPQADFVRCNAARLPFIEKQFALSVASFTFHEIYPSLHERVISELCRVSKRIMIVEPTIGEDPINRTYQEIWIAAMHSINQFEDYQSMDDWIGLLQNNGANVVTAEKLSYRSRLHGQEAKEYMRTAAEDMRDEGVSEEHVDRIMTLTKDVSEKGMILSDINVIIALTRIKTN
jgi:ubiquinone/menaquinone biosynthesis C-methylase UbiE